MKPSSSSSSRRSSSSLSRSSSSCSPPPLDSSSLRRWKYEVFISFRGKDTRMNFTDHLYAALDRAGVRAFIDAEGLKRGENIEGDLMDTIRECRISLVVFSENYADSHWCLQELVEIMECRRKLKQLAFPIFYHVDPSDVRNQTGSFGRAFEKHEAELLLPQGRYKIPQWKAVLKEAGSLSGFNVAGRHEVEFINSIVKEISRHLTSTYLNIAVYPVGIDSRVEDISGPLRVGVDNVLIIGIWGMGGIGKTTLSKAIYNKFYHHFESRSFLTDVRKIARNSHGKISMQERLLSDVLKPTKIEVSDVSEGINVIRERLGSKKVLIIVDDVDHQEQLHALAISHESFGRGSRIIITTRDQHVLELLNVNTKYRARGMCEAEALVLFSQHAFQKQYPDENFIELSKRVVTYCGGLPLALEVLGSLLFKNSVAYWESALEKLEKIPNARIQSTLRISYDALDESQKNTFLHICCFFIGMDKNHVVKILQGCGLSPIIDISILQQRCLITFGEKNKVMMHVLLRDMGREIVREESPICPERRSRLWRREDVIDVLTGTEATEGLALNLQRSEFSNNESIVRTKAFRNMKRLKLLQLNYLQLRGSYNNFSKRLSWLCLRGYTEKEMYFVLNERTLVSIDLRYSRLELFTHTRLQRLKILKLSHSHNLLRSPDFTQLPCLQYLVLKDCVALPEIHRSIGNLSELVLLNLKGCTMLKDLPVEFYNLGSVKTLVLSGCSRFRHLSRDIGKMAVMENLLINDTAISEVPSTVDNLLMLNFSSRQGLSGLRRVDDG